MRFATVILSCLVFSGSAIAASPNGVLLDFTATWCGPCQKMSPLVSRLKREGYPIRKVDVDQEPELAERFNVSSIPAFVLVVDGKEVSRSIGQTTEGNLRRMLSQIPSNEMQQPANSLKAKETLVASTDIPDGVVLSFTAPWCGPCQKMKPIVARLKSEGYPIKKIDVDQQPALVKRFKVSSIPAFVLVLDGKVVSRTVGQTTESNLKRMLAQIPAANTQQPANPEKEDSILFVSNNQHKKEQTSIQLAQNTTKPKKKSRGFNIPFFGKSKKSDESVPVEEPVIRAQFGESAGDHLTETTQKPAVTDWRASTVRIRVKDKKGLDLGSGTIIHSAVGRTLIMTCSHIFKELKEDSVIEVDVFQGEKHETYVGTLIHYNLAADVGLISIPTSEILPVAKVAAIEDQVKPGDLVASIGCNGGELPSIERNHVTRLNPFLGSDTIECTGMPVQGRSGGGLFDRSGQLVGVCFAVDKEVKRGFYAGLPMIHKLLDDSKLTAIYKQPEFQPQAPEPKMPAAEPNQKLLAEFLERAMPSKPVTTATTGNPDLSELQAALEQAGESEVVCIIRPLNKPKSASRVVIINKASPKFVSYLSGEVNNQPQPTSAHFKPDEFRSRESQLQNKRIARSLPRAAAKSRTRTISQPEAPVFRPPSSFTRTARKAPATNQQRREKIQQVENQIQRYRRSAESRR